jgi:hypothetical protein
MSLLLNRFKKQSRGYLIAKNSMFEKTSRVQRKIAGRLRLAGVRILSISPAQKLWLSLVKEGLLRLWNQIGEKSECKRSMAIVIC